MKFRILEQMVFTISFKLNHQHNKNRVGTIGKGVSSDETNPNKPLLVFNSQALLDFSSCNRFVDWIMCLVIFLPTWEQAIAMGTVLQFLSIFLQFFSNNLFADCVEYYLFPLRSNQQRSPEEAQCSLQMHSHSAMDRKADGNRFAPFARRKKTPSGALGLFDGEIQVQHLPISKSIKMKSIN